MASLLSQTLPARKISGLNENLDSNSGSITRYDLTTATADHLWDLINEPPAPIAGVVEDRIDAIIDELSELCVVS